MNETDHSDETVPIDQPRPAQAANEYLNISAFGLFGKILCELQKQEIDENITARERSEQAIGEGISFGDYSVTQQAYVLAQLFTNHGVDRNAVRDAVEPTSVTTWVDITTAYCHAALLDATTTHLESADQVDKVHQDDEKYHEWLKAPWEINLSIDLATEAELADLIAGIADNANSRFSISEDATTEIDQRIAETTESAADAIGGATFYYADEFTHDNPIRQASILSIANEAYGVDGSKALNRDHLSEYLHAGWRKVLTTPLIWDALEECVRVHATQHPNAYPNLASAIEDETQ